MEENEKNLPLNEKMKKLEEEILMAIEEMEDELDEINLPRTAGVGILNINIKKEDGRYCLRIAGREIGQIIDGKIEYDIEELKNVRETLEKAGYRYDDLGLPDIEYLEELEKDKAAEDEEELDKDGEEIEGEEQADEDKPELEEEGEEEEEKKKKEERPQDKKENLVELNDKVIKLLVPGTNEIYGKMWLNSNREIIGYNRQTKQKEPVKGISIDPKAKSIDATIHGTGKEGAHEHVNVEIMYRIDKKPNTGFAVARKGTEKGNMDLLYTTRRRTENGMDSISYVKLPLLASQEKVGTQTRIKDITGERQGINRGIEIDEALDERDEAMEERDIPEDTLKSFENSVKSEENGITAIDQLKEILTKAIMETKGIREVTAREIADVIVDENKTFKEAEDIVWGQQEQDYDDRLFPSRDPRGH